MQQMKYLSLPSFGESKYEEQKIKYHLVQKISNIFKSMKKPCIVNLFIILIVLFLVQYFFRPDHIAFTYPYNTYGFNYQCQKEEQIFHMRRTHKEWWMMKFYFKTKYGLYLPNCQAINRGAVKKWNHQRNIIQWAKVNLYNGAVVVYDLPQNNFLQLLTLSILVGPSGRILTTTPLNHQCDFFLKLSYRSFKNVYQIVKYDDIYTKYRIIISSNSSAIKAFLSQKAQPQLLFYVNKQSTSFEYNQYLQKLVGNENIKFSVVILNSSDCNSKSNATRIYNQKQVHQVKQSQQYFQLKNTNFIRQFDDDLFQQIEVQNQKYLNSIPPPSERKNIQQILSKYPIKSRQIQGASLQDLKQWQNQKQIVEWFKNQTKEYYNIFYSLNVFSPNLLAILNIGLIIQSGTIYVNCTEETKKTIEANMKKFKITNIKFVNNYKQVVDKCQLFITDSAEVVESVGKISQTELIRNKKMLVNIKQSQKKFQQLIYKLYTKFQIRKVDIYESFFEGYTIYDNFFIYSQNPVGFFDIQYQKYVIYLYWSNSVQSLVDQPNRYENVKELIRVNSVQVKIVTSFLLKYFEMPDDPFHPGFYHLSPTHRSDYVRGYLMNYYGGGYADIKHMEFDWYPYFKQLEDSPSQIYALGYKQTSSGDVACYQVQGKQSCKQIRKHYKQLIGNGQYIYKKLNPITKEWVVRMNQVIQSHYQDLKKVPKQLGTNPSFRQISNIPNYPLRWGEMGGAIIQRIQFQNLGHVILAMPKVIMIDYK